MHSRPLPTRTILPADQDGWLGNEHGAGSFNRYLADPCPNAYGSTFDWVAELDALVTALKPSSRVLVLYYEQLKLNLPAQIDRIDDFLGTKMARAARAPPPRRPAARALLLLFPLTARRPIRADVGQTLGPDQRGRIRRDGDEQGNQVRPAAQGGDR